PPSSARRDRWPRARRRRARAGCRGSPLSRSWREPPFLERQFERLERVERARFHCPARDAEFRGGLGDRPGEVGGLHEYLPVFWPHVTQGVGHRPGFWHAI